MSFGHPHSVPAWRLKQNRTGYDGQYSKEELKLRGRVEWYNQQFPNDDWTAKRKQKAPATKPPSGDAARWPGYDKDKAQRENKERQTMAKQNRYVQVSDIMCIFTYFCPAAHKFCERYNRKNATEKCQVQLGSSWREPRNVARQRQVRNQQNESIFFRAGQRDAVERAEAYRQNSRQAMATHVRLHGLPKPDYENMKRERKPQKGDGCGTFMY